jgi:hypothetical protein
MLPKLLLLAVILLLAWYGVRFVTRVGQVRQALRRAAEQAAMNSRGRDPHTPRLLPEDLVKCGVCGAFVPAKSATNCGRADCPY